MDIIEFAKFKKLAGGGSATPTQEKTIDITANGTVEVTPDEGYALKKVTANVNVPKDGVDKVQRYIELNNGSAEYMFDYFTGTSLDELIAGVDTSLLTNTSRMFLYCSALTSVPSFDTSNVTNMSNMLAHCEKITTVPLFDTSNVTNMSNMLEACSALTSVPSFDTRNASTLNSMVYGCKALTECWIRNIKVNLQVSNGTSWGHLLTLESLLHLCKECCNVNVTRKLTIGTANLEKLANVYVKLIDITDDMRAEDDLIDKKYPFIQCESTDEGAMTIQDYMATKMWSLA